MYWYFSERMYEDLKLDGIPCTLILDSAVGYIMEQVSFIMTGAEGVVESGGIVNKVTVFAFLFNFTNIKKYSKKTKIRDRTFYYFIIYLILFLFQ